MRYDDVFSQEERNTIINEYVNEGCSIRFLCDKYNIKCHAWIQKLLKGKTRTTSEASRLYHSSHPGAAKACITEHMRAVLREKRLKYMKEHPEETAWRKRNKPSYPEQCFINFLQRHEYDKRFLIEREHSVFPFYIDFAFVDIKLAIEIDGSQHLKEDRKQRDEEKERTLKENGWRLIRVSEDIAKHNTDSLKEVIDFFLIDDSITYKKVGILKAPKTRTKSERGEDGLTEKQRQSCYRQRHVKNRPSKEELQQILFNNPNFTAIGRQYGVDGNTIRKWCKGYKIEYHVDFYKRGL